MKDICVGLALGLIVGMTAVTYSSDVKKLTKKTGDAIVEKVQSLKK